MRQICFVNLSRMPSINTYAYYTLDYCNSLFFAISTRIFARLQRIQNTLARFLLRKRKFDQITPSLMELHWLLIQQRVHFKFVVLHNTIHTKEPDYLLDLVKFYELMRTTLHSSSRGLLSRTRTRTVIAFRAFKHSSVFVWNIDIRNCDSLLAFRRRLKSFLFNSAFTP